MTTGLDHVADKNHTELARLLSLYPPPAFVKQADIAATCPSEPLAPALYADPFGKQFPCHSPAATWLSALYFSEKRGAFHPKAQERIAERLAHYTDYWHVRDAVDAITTRRAAYLKEAAEASALLDDSYYAYVAPDPATGLKERRLPLRHAEEVKAAAAWLERYRDHFRFTERHQMATRILDKAAAYGAAVTPQLEFLEKQAGRGVGDPAAIVGLVRQRAKLASAPMKEGLENLARALQEKPKQLMFDLVKLAETLDDIDEALHLRGKYTDVIRRVEDVLFSATFAKAAAELAERCQLTTGTAYQHEQLAKVALDDLRSLFGDAFADEVRNGLDINVEKLAEVAKTLPRGDAELFDAMMSELGERPALHKTAATGGQSQLAQEEWRAMAEAYCNG